MLYSPTRGCYWNKCTFCDYGLNTDRPTSPSRERPVPAVLTDLAAAARHGRVVYFAVDAMSPRYLRTLAQALAESGPPIRWAAELRLERTFPRRGTAELLARSGCVAISFGYESGSQRILDLIDKGVRIAEVPAVLAELARHQIAAQMMGFTGFPTETAAEAEETYQFLLRHRELWSLSAIGTFQLTPGSIVARQPGRFGIELVALPPAQDIERALPWRDRGSGQEHWGGDLVPASLRAAVKRSVDDRPWVGGVDTGHSLLYFDRYGPKLAPQGDEAPAAEPVSEQWLSIPFADIAEFTSPRQLEEQYERAVQAGGAVHELMRDWLAGPGQARRGAGTVLVLPSGVTVTMPAAGGAGGPLAATIRILARARGAA